MLDGSSRSRARSARLVIVVTVLAALSLARVAVAGDTLPHPVPVHPGVMAALQAAGYDSATVVDLRARAARMRAAGIDRGQPLRAPLTGSKPALVLLVDFSDVAHNSISTPGFYNDLLFSVGTYAAPGSMRDFYRKASYNAFDVNPGQVDSTWRKLPHPRNYYANNDGKSGTDDDYGMGEYPNNSQGLCIDAVQAADPYVDFSTFAQSGEVPGLFIIHAGQGAETAPTHYDYIWSHQWSLGQHAITVDGVQVNAYTVEPEFDFKAGDMTIGVFCHEYGHVLGLPDLYDTTEETQGVGDWSLMGGGVWNGPAHNASSPALPDAWCRIQLGWINPQRPTSSTTHLQLAASEDTPTAVQVYPGNVVANESFVIENRQLTSFDTYLPGPGLLIYHVDESSEQTNPYKPLVMVEQADGLSDLQTADGLSDAGDPFPGSTSNIAFTAASNPNSHCYGGGNSQLSVTNISASGPTMSFDLGLRAFALLQDFPLDSDPGWSTKGQWAFGAPTGQGTFPDPTAGYDGPYVYGYNLKGDYTDNMASTDYLTTTPLDCTHYDEVALTFWRWLGVENGGFDEASVEVSNDGVTWTVIYLNPTETPIWDGQWVRWFADISPLAAGKSSVYVRWGIGPTDDSFHLCGWNIDDVQLWGLEKGSAGPIADFVASPTSGGAPLAVAFTDISTNGPTAWSWDFGDGGTATTQSPSHTYTADGIYTVKLTATNAGGSDALTKRQLVVVNSASPVVANFTTSPDHGTAPIAVSFTDTSIGSPTAWAWSFGDGATATDQSPSHTYTKAGRYAITLAATGAAGTGTTTKSHYLLVTFTDVPFTSWAVTQILSCVEAGIVSGFPGGTYEPTWKVTRDQMAVYIARALAGGDASVPAGPAAASFPDVPTTNWAYKYIEYCKAQHIVTGYADGYHPLDVVTRDQMAVYMARSIVTPTGDDGLTSYAPPAVASFPDVPTGFWAFKYVEYCKSQSIVQGYADGYHPADPVTRDQMAVYVYRAFELN